MINFVDAVKTSKSDLIYIVRAEEQVQNENAWYYVQVRDKKTLPIFLEESKEGLDLEEYADVLYSGWGDEPPQEIKDKIAKQFG